MSDSSSTDNASSPPLLVERGSGGEVKTFRDHLKAIGGALLIVGFTLALIEIAVRVVDPWGLSYFEDLAYMGNDLFTPDDQRGYIIPDGEYQFSRWQARIVDGGRYIPATSPDAACQISVLGDSVAFSYGANDDTAWVNLVAAQLPNMTIRNLALPRYNSTNAMLTQQAYPDADGYLYVIIGNDLEPAIDPATQDFTGSGAGLPWFVRYMNFAIYRGGGTDFVATDVDNVARVPESARLDRLMNELDALLATERVTLAAFQGDPLTNTLIARGYTVLPVVYPAQYRISLADYHLNAAGNVVFADEFLPVFKQLAATYCDA
jgi:hypothetical protein